MKQYYFIVLAIIFLYSCKQEPKSHIDTAAKTESSDSEWISLFDGTSLNGWRAYNNDSMPPGWKIDDGILTFDRELMLESDYEGGRDIIYGAEEFDNFDLYLEWKLPEGGNSGIFYHLKEGYSSPPVVSPEYQLIDDVNYARIHDLTDYNISIGNTDNPSKLQVLQQTASDYAMHEADSNKKTLHPIGDWNSSRIVFTPEKVEHWLNGEMVLSFVPWSEDWNARKNSGKWDNAPDYGKYKSGFIGLQDHGSALWFRNIKIKKL